MSDICNQRLHVLLVSIQNTIPQFHRTKGHVGREGASATHATRPCFILVFSPGLSTTVTRFNHVPHVQNTQGDLVHTCYS